MMDANQDGMWILRVMTVADGDLASDDFLFARRDDVAGFLRTFREEAKAEGTDCTNAYWLIGPITSGMAVNEASRERLDENTERWLRRSPLSDGLEGLDAWGR